MTQNIFFWNFALDFTDGIYYNIMVAFIESLFLYVWRFNMDASIKQKFDNIKNMIGNTPLLEISLTFDGEPRKIYAKAEYLSLTGSIKDRVAYYIMYKAYERGTIHPGCTVAEATSGNTGIAFSAMSSYLGHKTVIYTRLDEP